MLGRPYRIGNHTICAFLDCKQVKILEQYKGKLRLNLDLEAIIGKMHQLEHRNLNWILRKHLEHFYDDPNLLKSLVHERAPEYYIQMV